MIHHVCILWPIRTFVGLMLLAGAVLCWYFMAAAPVDTAAPRNLTAAADRQAADSAEATAAVASKLVAIERSPIANPPRPASDAAGPRPDWVGRPPHLESQGGIDVYVATATAGPYSTQEECDRALGSEIDRAIADFADKQLQPAVERPVKLDPEEIQEHLIQGRYRETIHSSVGPMQQEYVLLVFDGQVRAAIEQQQRANAVAQRLRFAAGGCAAVLLALGGVYSLLRRQPAAAARS